MKKFFKILFVVLMVGFLAGLFFPQVVQAYWTAKKYFAEGTGSGTKYHGNGYNGHGYYYFQYGGSRTYSSLTWGQDSTDIDTTFNWQAFIPSSNTGTGKAYVRYEGQVSTNGINQAMYSGWVIVLSDRPTNYSTLYMGNSCVSGQTCNNLEVEWDDVNVCFWYGT